MHICNKFPEHLLRCTGFVSHSLAAHSVSQEGNWRYHTLGVLPMHTTCKCEIHSQAFSTEPRIDMLEGNHHDQANVQTCELSPKPNMRTMRTPSEQQKARIKVLYKATRAASRESADFKSSSYNWTRKHGEKQKVVLRQKTT
eukprot:6489620-Amphidinium_carterae.2